MDAIEEYMLLENRFLPLLLINQQRTCWVNDIFTTRDDRGEFILFPELLNDTEKFFEYFRMKPKTFYYILDGIKAKLQKQSNFRKCLEPIEKLIITLRYLSTGMAFRSLSFSFRVSHTTIRLIVYDTCEAIWEKFHEVHMPFPTEQMFVAISEEFNNKWNFPNCIGCIDGKHIRIKCPAHSGSMFYNYKQYYSIVLQAVADANCKFICIDVGAYGKQSDGGIFSKCSLHAHLESNSMNVPEPKELPNTDVVLPHVLLGDEAYPLKVYLMRPYPRNDLNREAEIFNYRLSRARRVVECAFGILVSKWRLLRKEIEVHPDNVDKIVKCVCLLHNIIINEEGLTENTVRQHMTESSGSNDENTQKSRFNNRATNTAYAIREHLKTYFCGIGSVPFQENRA